MKIIVINTSGGVGKTTTAIALALLAKGKTLLVDASHESSLTAFFEPDKYKVERHNFFSFISGKSSFADCVIHINPNLDLLPGFDTMEDDTRKVDLKLDLPYSNFIIDTQPAYSNINKACILFSNLVLFPCRVKLNMIESVANYAQQLTKRCAVLPTMYKSWFPPERKEMIHFNLIKNVEILPYTKYYLMAETQFSKGKLHKKLLQNYKDSIGGLYEGANDPR